MFDYRTTPATVLWMFLILGLLVLFIGMAAMNPWTVSFALIEICGSIFILRQRGLL